MDKKDKRTVYILSSYTRVIPPPHILKKRFKIEGPNLIHTEMSDRTEGYGVNELSLSMVVEGESAIRLIENKNSSSLRIDLSEHKPKFQFEMIPHTELIQHQYFGYQYSRFFSDGNSLYRLKPGKIGEMLYISKRNEQTGEWSTRFHGIPFIGKVEWVHFFKDSPVFYSNHTIINWADYCAKPIYSVNRKQDPTILVSDLVGSRLYYVDIQYMLHVKDLLNREEPRSLKVINYLLEKNDIIKLRDRELLYNKGAQYMIAANKHHIYMYYRFDYSKYDIITYETFEVHVGKAIFVFDNKTDLKLRLKFPLHHNDSVPIRKLIALEYKHYSLLLVLFEGSKDLKIKSYVIYRRQLVDLGSMVDVGRPDPFIIQPQYGLVKQNRRFSIVCYDIESLKKYSGKDQFKATLTSYTIRYK